MCLRKFSPEILNQVAHLNETSLAYRRYIQILLLILLAFLRSLARYRFITFRIPNLMILLEELVLFIASKNFLHL
jgi:hypothetical protein